MRLTLTSRYNLARERHTRFVLALADTTYAVDCTSCVDFSIFLNKLFFPSPNLQYHCPWLDLLHQYLNRRNKVKNMDKLG
jgi:hypothetical protein